MNLPAMGIPVVNYSPETTWEFGAAAQAYFRLPNQERTSIVQFDGTYSLKHQWYINAQGALYFGAKSNNPSTTANCPTWQLHFRVGYSNRPATYYSVSTMDATVSIRKQESCEKAESDVKAFLALSPFGTSLPLPGLSFLS